MSSGEQLFEQLGVFGNSATVIIGIGNTLKGDDGAGPLVCERLAGRVCADVIDAGTVPENYIQTIIRKNPAVVLVVDAMDFGGDAGEIRVFKPEELSSVAISTHTLSPRLFVEMIGRNIKVEVYFVGIQPAHIQMGQAISAQVSDAIERLGLVLTEIFRPR